ncbi:MAG: hypothetical protein LBC98_06555 [Prevotellaceae bacterium]|jgi:hypothetical protein|nr:hypothetical protein [Prevotellaceae bacterium]
MNYELATQAGLIVFLHADDADLFYQTVPSVPNRVGARLIAPLHDDKPACVANS